MRGYDLTFDGLVPRQGPNYRELIAQVHRAQRRRCHRHAWSRRSAPSRRAAMSTTEAALLTRGVSQLYLSLGDAEADGSIAVRLYHKPLVLLIWLGAW